MTELDQNALDAAIRAVCIAGPECRYPCDGCEEEPMPCRGATIAPKAITAYLATRREQGYEERRVDVAGAVRAISPEDLAEAIKAAGAVKWDRLA